MTLPLGFFSRRFERELKHLPRTDDLSLITLKGHLLIEEVLEDLIKHRCNDPDVLHNVDMSFFLKAKLANAFWGTRLANDYEIPANTWEAVEALNSLRNEFAHRLESPAVEKKLQKFLQLYSRNKLPSDDPSEKATSLLTTISFLYAVLSSFEDVIKRPERYPTKQSSETDHDCSEVPGR